MKVNFQKIIAVCVTACICLSLLTVNVFADNYGGIVGITQNDVDYILDILNIAKDVASGQKSVQEGYSAVLASGNRLVSQQVKTAIVFPFSSETELNGVTPRDFADKITTNVRQGLRGLGGDIDDNTITTDNVDTKGYGAIMHIDTANSSLPWDNYYCDYIIISTVDGSIRSATFYGSDNLHTWNDIYAGDKSNSFKNGLIFDNIDILNSVGDFTTKFYGDIRYSDGSSADSIKSPTQSITQGIDTSQLTDQELIDLLQDMVNKLKLQFPDLSTIEGLLASIYNRLGTLDSDNDNELLSQILTAIQALQTSGGGGDNTELINTLNEIKNKLVFGEGDEISSLAELLKTLIDNQLSADDFVIDEDAYNQRGEVLKLRLLGKFEFIESLKGLISYMMTSYSSSASLPALTLKIFDTSAEMDFSWLTEHLPLFQAILAAYIYISYAFHTYRKIPSYINGGDNE